MESDVKLLEKTVQHNVDDIRELKKQLERNTGDIHDLKVNQQVTQNSVGAIQESINELKLNFKQLDQKMDKDREEQLKQYKSAIWKVGIAIVSAVFLMFLGLN